MGIDFRLVNSRQRVGFAVTRVRDRCTTAAGCTTSDCADPRGEIAAPFPDIRLPPRADMIGALGCPLSAKSGHCLIRHGLAGLGRLIAVVLRIWRVSTVPRLRWAARRHL